MIVPGARLTCLQWLIFDLMQMCLHIIDSINKVCSSDILHSISYIMICNNMHVYTMPRIFPPFFNFNNEFSSRICVLQHVLEWVAFNNTFFLKETSKNDKNPSMYHK